MEYVFRGQHHSALFSYRLSKLNRLKNIAAQRPFESGWRLLTYKNWAVVLDEVDWGDFEYIADDFFVDLEGENLTRKLAVFERAIVILPPYPPQAGANNLQTLKQFSAFRQMCPNTLFLGWDWDNHFNLHISSVFAAASDLYFPTHLANEYELSRFCSHKYHLPSSSYQWGRRFLTDNMALLLRHDRSDQAYGRFKHYGLFGYRNAVVTTLGAKLPGVSLVDDLADYHAASPVEKLESWTRHKCHWVVPTLNDVSTRIFDALITGGIVLIPEHFRSDSAIKTLHGSDCLFYTEGDILEPQAITAKAIANFDRDGHDGVLRRHRDALDHHNLDSRMKVMADTARAVLGRTAEQSPDADMG